MYQTQKPRVILSPRARFFWILRTSGWGVLLILGIFILLGEIFEVSRVVTDFCQDYQAAQRLLQGHAIYVPLRCFPGHNPAPLEYDSHPPFSVLMFAPLGHLSESSAAIVWGIISLGAYLASGIFLLEALGWLSPRGMTLFVLGSIFWQAFIREEAAQNLTQLLTLFLIAAWYLERRGNVSWAGWLIGLAGLLKLWPIVLLVNPVIKRRWRLVWMGGISALFGSILALVILGPEAYTGYLGPAQAIEKYWVPNGANVSLVGAVARLFTGYWQPPLIPALVHGISLSQAVMLGEGLAGLLLAATVVFCWKCWRRKQSEVAELIENGLLVTVLIIVFPINWWWGIIPLLLPGTIIILALRQIAHPPRWWFVLLVGSLLPLVVPRTWVVLLPEWLMRQDVEGLVGLGVLLYGIPTYAILLFASAQALLLWWVTKPLSPGGVLDASYASNRESV